MSPQKRFVFTIVLVLLPFLLLGSLEGVLRLLGWGGFRPMFHPAGPVEGGTLTVADQGGADSWFFANPDRPGYNEQYTFVEPKPANTVRVFLVGESAIQGYPQPRNLGSSAFLQEMLQDAWPDRKVEVINLGTVAVASFPVLGIMTEALAHEPDLVVVYTGHNEFFGTYGVASVGQAGSKPWMLKAHRTLRSLALVQLLTRILPARQSQSKHTLMEAMQGASYIGPDDWRRKAAANNLFHNIDQMIARCQARGISVLVCNQPSNERGLAPIGDDRWDGLSASAREEAESKLAQAESSMKNDPSASEKSLRRVLELKPDHARAHFLLGQVLLAQGRQPDSLEAFARARDLDPMPWRTPALSQESILRATTARKAPLCDLVKAFRNTAGGPIGWELMDDHVHPTLRGQALIAETIVESLARFPGRVGVSTEARAKVRAWNDYARRLGENIYDDYGVAHQMRILFGIPFMQQNNGEAFQRFNGIVTQIEQTVPPHVLTAMRDWQTTRPHAGARSPITAVVAHARMQKNETKEAMELYQIAQRGVPQYTSWYLEYVYFALACKEKLAGGLTAEDKQLAAHAIRQGEFLIKHPLSNTEFAERYTGLLHLLRAEFAAAIPLLEATRPRLKEVDLVATELALVACYLKTGQFDKAAQLATEGASRKDAYSPRYEMLLKEMPALMREATNTSGISNSPPRGLTN